MTVMLMVMVTVRLMAGMTKMCSVSDELMAETVVTKFAAAIAIAPAGCWRLIKTA